MSLSREEAAATLAEAENFQKRSRESLGYSQSAPYLLLTGVYWVLGYGATQFWPRYIPVIWGWGAIVFLVAMIWISHRTRRREITLSGKDVNRKLGFIFGAVVPAFALGTMAVMWPMDGIRIGAFLPLLYSAVYTGMGLWMGLRFVIAGITVFCATLIGYFLLPEYFSLWMAVFAGGSMLLTGVWMRRS